MVPPPLVTETETDDELPLFKVKVPPESTGLEPTPKLLSDTVEPDVTEFAGGIEPTAGAGTE